MRVYVIMKRRLSPIVTFPDFPHEVYEDKKMAEVRVEYLNERASVNEYWVEEKSVALFLKN